MATPTEKSPAINWTLNRLIERDRQKAILNDECVSCGRIALIFCDDLGRREYEDTGLCEACQEVFEQEDE